MSDKVYGHFVVRSLTEGDDYEHRIECHHPEDSPMWEKVERGLLLRIDPEGFYVGWEAA